MSRALILKRVAVITVAAGLTAGCALLSTPDPVQMYRFGASETAMQEAAPATMSQLRPVGLRRIQFPEAARGDRILAITGTEAAYISGARWVSPADELFNEAVIGAFSDQSRNVRLIGPREFSRSALSLDIDVRSFEARYAYVGAAPAAHIVARARLLQFPDREVVDERVFTVSVPASDNRVSAIVAAFDAATADLGAQIVDWTDAAAANTPVPESD